MLPEGFKKRLRRLPGWIVLAVPPAVLAGALYAILVFFLNPRLDPRFVTLLRAIALFSAVFLVPSVAIHAIVGLSSRRAGRRFLPWSLSIVLTLGAVAAWINASRFSFYIPPGLDNRMIKAAVWLSVASLACFYTALLHSLAGRRYGRRSVALIAIVSVLAPLVSIERRLAYREPAREIPGPSATHAEASPRLLAVAIDAATLDAILPLAEQGRLPFFSTLLRQGTYGRLETIGPVRRTPVWFSVATGQYPYRHGVVSSSIIALPFLGIESEIHLTPFLSGLRRWGRLVGIRERLKPPRLRSPALWDYFQRADISTALVGWPAPDESLAGCDIAISDGFLRRSGAGAEELPPGLQRGFLDPRVDGASLDPALLARFEAEPSADLRSSLAQDLWREQIASRILTQESTGAVFLGLPGLGLISQESFGGYLASQFEGQHSSEIDAAARRTTAYYVFLDEMLARLWQRVASPKLLAVVSAWGVDEPGLLQKASAAATGSRSVEGRVASAPDGVFMLLGENLSSGTYLDRAGITDVTPTLLYSLGLPLAPDLDGRVLARGFSATFLNRTPLTFVPSFREKND